MILPDWLRPLLPPDTAGTWEAIADAVPPGAYLGGGTALAVHLRHRLSRDLDFFLPAPVELGTLADALGARGPLRITTFDDTPGRQTLNAVFSATKLQFLEASTLAMVEPTIRVAGVDVAGLGDLLAMKLKVLGDRNELRDYFDLKVIDETTGRRVEEGIALFVEKYAPRGPDQAVSAILRALAYLDDVEADPLVPEGVGDIEKYWRRRVPEITRNLSRYG
jgi:enoyl-CoA hydratase/carnithine racemase